MSTIIMVILVSILCFLTGMKIAFEYADKKYLEKCIGTLNVFWSDDSDVLPYLSLGLDKMPNDLKTGDVVLMIVKEVDMDSQP